MLRTFQIADDLLDKRFDADVFKSNATVMKYSDRNLGFPTEAECEVIRRMCLAYINGEISWGKLEDELTCWADDLYDVYFVARKSFELGRIFRPESWTRMNESPKCDKQAAVELMRKYEAEGWRDLAVVGHNELNGNWWVSEEGLRE